MSALPAGCKSYACFYLLQPFAEQDATVCMAHVKSPGNAGNHNSLILSNSSASVFLELNNKNAQDVKNQDIAYFRILC